MKFFVLSALFLMISPFALAITPQNSQSVAGYWQTIDGKTKKPSSIIAIAPAGNYYVGKIVKTYSGTSDKKITVCDLCKGELKNKPIIGLPIVQHMTCRPGYCNGGTILDPRNGKIYKATMRLVAQGSFLKVRGYIGAPLFGKTVVWRRVNWH